MGEAGYLPQLNLRSRFWGMSAKIVIDKTATTNKHHSLHFGGVAVVVDVVECSSFATKWTLLSRKIEGIKLPSDIKP